MTLGNPNYASFRNTYKYYQASVYHLQVIKMVAYKHTPHQNNQAQKGYHTPVSVTGVQYNSARELRPRPYQQRNEKQSLDDLVQLNRRFLSAPEKIGIQSGNFAYSQVSHHRESYQKVSAHHETNNAGFDNNEDYDSLQPVWFEKIMQKIEENKASEKKPSEKGRSYISLN